MSPSQNAALLSIVDAAKLLSLSKRTLQQWTAEGRVKSVRLGRAVRIPRTELERIITEGVPRLGERR